MKLIALKDLPNHVKAGDRFEVNDVQGGVLIKALVARLDDAAPLARRPTYRRRDLTAEQGAADAPVADRTVADEDVTP